MKNSIKDIMNELASLGNRADQMEKIISDTENRNDAEERRERLEHKKQKIKSLYKNYLTPSERAI